MYHSQRNPANKAGLHCRVNGIWGLLAVGWNGVARDAISKSSGYGYDGVTGILYGDASQLWIQLLDAGVVIVFGFVMAYVWFKLSDFIFPIRVSQETEIAGLDAPEMGALGYPDFAVAGRN